MSYIIKSPDDLKDPFLCYCVFHRFMEEAGEDYIDYNECIVKYDRMRISFINEVG